LLPPDVIILSLKCTKFDLQEERSGK